MKAVSKQLTGSCDKILMGILVEGFCFLDTVIDVLRLRGLLEVAASFKTDDNFWWIWERMSKWFKPTSSMDVSMCVCVHEYIYVWIQQNNFPTDHTCVLRRSPHRTLVECPNEARTLALDHPQQTAFLRQHHVAKSEIAHVFFLFFHGWSENPLWSSCALRCWRIV